MTSENSRYMYKKVSAKFGKYKRPRHNHHSSGSGQSSSVSVFFKPVAKKFIKSQFSTLNIDLLKEKGTIPCRYYDANILYLYRFFY